ncbi:hypothetical protein [Botrimarina sp.]|uniref:hypothetical protein n=1 Tax=Botrimarina sp. TaxID=2795802 RepID=UPI0032EB3281
MRCLTVTQRPALVAAAVVAFLVSVSSVPPAAAEWPSLWPSDKAEADTAEAPAETGDQPLLESPFFQVGWPKVELPKINWKPGFGGADEAPAGTGENPVSRALDRMATGSRNAADKVRSAWGSAIDALTPGGGEAQTAQKEPGFWSRLLAPEEPVGPRTTTEFLAQDRPGTTR